MSSDFENRIILVTRQEMVNYYINAPFPAELPNVTFRNPTADRPQMILEFYEAYHDYHYAKIQVRAGVFLFF